MRARNAPSRALRRPLSLAGALAALSLLPPACKSAEEYRAEADRQVYALIDARRAALFEDPGGFTIAEPEDSLRARLLSGEAHAAEPLGLADFLEIAAENNREYQARREDLYRAALDLTLERWRYSWVGDGSAFGAADFVGDEAIGAEAGGGLGISRVLGTGGVLLADLGASLTRALFTGDGWDLVRSMSFSFTQPLLSGAGRRIALEPLTQAERDLIYEVRAFERFRRTFALDVVARVYDLLRSLDALQNERANYQSLLDLRRRNEALAQAGRLSEIEADQARQDELRSEANILRQEAAFERQLDSFKLFLGLPIDVELTPDRTIIERLDDADPLLDGLAPRTAVSVALAQRLDFLTRLDRVDDVARSLYIAADALRPGLGITLAASNSSPEGRPLSVSEDRTPWSVVLDLDLPFDQIPERNDYRRSLIALQAAERQAEEEADSIVVDVRDALRQIETAARNFEIQRGAVELGNRRVASTQLSLDAGRASTRDVLEAQESLLSAQNQATDALIDLYLTRLEFYLALELLRVEARGIEVDEAPLVQAIAAEERP